MIKRRTNCYNRAVIEEACREKCYELNGMLTSRARMVFENFFQEALVKNGNTKGPFEGGLGDRQREVIFSCFESCFAALFDGVNRRPSYTGAYTVKYYVNLTVSIIEIY